MKQILKYFRQHRYSGLLILIAVVLAVGLLTYRLSASTHGALSSVELKTVQTTYGWHGIRQQPLNLPINLVRSAIFVTAKNHDAFVSRLSSVLFGLLSIGAVITLTKIWHGRRTAILIGLLYACAAWTLHISRVATNDVLYLSAVPTLLLSHTASFRRGNKALAWYGMILLAGFMLYVPGMIWLVMLTVYWQRLAIKQGWRHFKQWWQRTLYILAGLVWLPLLVDHIRHLNTLKSWLGLPRNFVGFGAILRQFGMVLVNVFVRGPNNSTLWLGRAPIFDVFTLVMVLAGIYFYTRHYKASRSRLLVGYLVIGWLLAGLNGPVGLSIVVPVLYLIAATGIAYLLHDWFKVFPNNPIARGLANSLMVLAVLISCGYNLTAYFVAWPNDATTQSTFHYRPRWYTRTILYIRPDKRGHYTTMSRFDQAKMLMRVKKIQKELQKQIITVEKGDGAVSVEISGEQKLKRIKIDPKAVDLDDIGELERWVEDAVKEAIAESQRIAAEKMQPMMGALGDLGL